jgi:hypothetical protein
MDKKPATRNASLPIVPANLRVISTPVPDVRNQLRRPVDGTAIGRGHSHRSRYSRGSDGLVLLFGQGRLAEIGQQLIQSLKGHSLSSRDFDSERTTCRPVVDNEQFSQNTSKS